MSAAYLICLDARTIDTPRDFNSVGENGDDFVVVTYTQELIEILLACGDDEGPVGL